MDFDAEMRAAFARLPQTIVDEVGEERVAELFDKDPDKFSEIIQQAVHEGLQGGGHALAEQLKKDGPAMLARRRAERRGFEERLAHRWARPFDLAEMAIVVAYEVGEDFNAKHRQQAAAEDDVVFEVLVRLHARACRIAEEVLALLRAGFGQGAMARWRVLHEVAVVAYFIAEHGQDTAERYFLHEGVESWKAMEEFQERVDRLNEDPFGEDDVREAKERFDQLVERYGKEYAGPYGWANEALAKEDPKWKKQRVRFSDIENAVTLDHLRPYYRMASHGVHANPKGILFTPDLLDGEPEVLLAGPGSTGLADPGQSALISLNQVTATLLTYKNGSEASVMILVALLDLVDEAAEAYVATHREVENPRNVPHYGIAAHLRFRLMPILAVARVRAHQLAQTARGRVRERHG